MIYRNEEERATPIGDAKVIANGEGVYVSLRLNDPIEKKYVFSTISEITGKILHVTSAYAGDINPEILAAIYTSDHSLYDSIDDLNDWSTEECEEFLEPIIEEFNKEYKMIRGTRPRVDRIFY